jgi:predicted ATPase/transcriptional regulator with XRE-family HTH domain
MRDMRDMRDMDGGALPPFGELLRRHRGRARLTQEQVAERAQVSARTIRNLERGAPHAPRDDTLHLLAAALDLSAEERAAFVTAGHALRALHVGDTPPVSGGGSGLLPHSVPLPLPPTPLIGREQEQAQATAALTSGEVRLLTLVGAPGVGKTHLALALAAALERRMPDGVAFVDLAPLDDSALVVGAIARAAGVREIARPSALEAAIAGLRDRHLLLLIDNCEHLLAAAADLAALLAACPLLRLLATSRASLAIRSERVLEVSPLALPDEDAGARGDLAALAAIPAVALLLARARAMRPDFALTEDNAASVVAICRRLDGLPLALELAAAQLRLLTPQALLARLDRTLSALSGGPRDLPERQRALRAALDWSHDLLPARERTFFRRLAVCVGGCTLEAAWAICASPARGDGGPPDTDTAVVEAITNLVDHHLLRREVPAGTAETASEAAFADVRVGMLETIRQYARERLDASVEAELVRSAHAVYYLALAERADPHLRGPEQTAWLVRLEREHANLRAALEWALSRGDAEMSLRFAAALWRFWELHGYLREGRTWLGRALALADIASVPTTGSAVGLEERRARALDGAGWLALRQGDFVAAVALSEEAVARYRMLGNRRGLASTLQNLGLVARARGDHEAAARLLQESLALWRALDDAHGAAGILNSLAGIAWARGDHAQARALLEESLPLIRKAGDTQGLAATLENLAEVARAEREWARAEALLERGLALRREVGDVRGMASALQGLGQLAAACERPAEAAARYRESLALCRHVGDQALEAEVLRALAGAQAAQGDYREACAQCQESLLLYEALSLDEGVLACLEDMADLLLRGGRPEPAARLLAAATRIRATTGRQRGPEAPEEQGRHERRLHACAQALGQQRFTGAWTSGEQPTLSRAIGEAMAIAAEGLVGG